MNRFLVRRGRKTPNFTEQKAGKRRMRYSEFIVTRKKNFSLKKMDPVLTGEFKDETEARAAIERDAEDLAKYQNILAAHERYRCRCGAHPPAVPDGRRT